MSFPETISVIAIDKTGGIDVLEKKTVPFPTQKPGEIVVRIIWGGVNTIDTYFRKGLYPIKSFPQALGMEASGIIVKLPSEQDVSGNKWYQERGYKVGGRVAISSYLGAHAEYISVPWKLANPIPDDIKLDIAAASMSHGLTALTLMSESYSVQKGDIILVHTVAGGLGLAFTAYAKSRGATVIGTTSTPEKAELAKSYGADYVILYTKENTVQRVLEITNGEGVHAVFDGVGKDTFLANFDLLRRKGTLVAVGNASGAPDPVSPLKLAPKNLKLLRPTMGNYMVTQEETEHYLAELWQALRSGLFKIRIERVFPFTTEGVREAQTELTTPGGTLAGKILLKIAEE